MASTAMAAGVENLVLNINTETRVRASLDATFAALRDAYGDAFDTASAV